MESPSDPAHRGCVPWQGLMLTASLLTFWNLPTNAQVIIESVPPNVVEGKNVLLRVHNLPENLRTYTWFIGDKMDKSLEIAFYLIKTQRTMQGPAYSHRETVYPNGSLMIRFVTLQDTGYYTLQFTDSSFLSHFATGQFHVYPLLYKPSLISNKSNSVEHKGHVVLTCESLTQNITYRWLFNNQSLPASARLQLSKDNKTLTLISLTRNDTGSYECEIWNPVSDSRSDPLTLNVHYGPDAPNISPSDSYYLRGANLRLSCHAASYPPAQYFWIINGFSQNTQELFIPNITVNNSGSYICLAQNSVTLLKRMMLKTITVYEPVGKPVVQASNARVIENMDAVNLTCLTNDTEISTRWLFKNQSLLLTDRMKLSQDNSTLTIKPVRRENAGDYQCEVFNPASSTKSDPFKLDVQYDATLSPRLSDRAIGGVVTGLLAGVALIAALMFFVYMRKTRRARDQRDLQNKPSASKRSQSHSENSPNKMDESTYSSIDFNAQESQKPTYASPFPTATETVYSET